MIKYEKEFDKKFGTFYVSGFKWQGKDGPDFGELDMKRYINKCLLRQIDEDNKRFLGMIGEDEKIDWNDSFSKIAKLPDGGEHLNILVEGQNRLRAELRDKVTGNKKNDK